MRIAVPLLLGAAALLSACSTPAPRKVAFLAVGDTGYHYDFLDEEDFDPPLTREQFIEREREDWAEDHLPPELFTLPPEHVLPNGGVVAASGLMPVANAMKRWCGTHQCDFATMLGDNIYPDGATAGADGRSDAERFEKLFMEPYRDLGGGGAEFRIYTTLGNHDWKTSRAGALSQLHFHESTRPFFMDGFFYTVKPPSAQGLVEIFVLETELMLTVAGVPDAAVGENGTEVLLDEPDHTLPGAIEQAALEPDRVAWLEQALANSTAKWKIVIGHHPLWSTAGTKFAQARALRALILPALCRYADLYLAGHEHTLEFHEDDCSTAGGATRPFPQVVSGAGAKQRPTHPPFSAHQQRDNPQLRTLFAEGMIWGFAHIELEGDTATLRLLTTPNDARGEPVEAYTVTLPRRSGDARGATSGT